MQKQTGYMNFHSGTRSSQKEKTKRSFTENKKASGTIRREKKIGRNDPCPCGSGKKYKKCCGK